MQLQPDRARGKGSPAAWARVRGRAGEWLCGCRDDSEAAQGRAGSLSLLLRPLSAPLGSLPLILFPDPRDCF